MAITKTACYTDIHFGKKSNSLEHNQDCLDFIAWFCNNVIKDGDISHVVFLGDFFENRSSLNILTLEMAYRGLKMLNSLGIPVIHIVGNHDLHRRSTREIHSVNIFNEMENFIVVDQPKVIEDTLFCPYVFGDEYDALRENYSHIPYWYGHFEFKNFMVTGYNTVMKHGPDHRVFNGPKKIFAGHFHKRQVTDNVVYIGNTFPMDFGDAGDDQRGMMTCNHVTDEVLFENWDDCPKYMKTSLSKIAADDWNPQPKTRVRCVVDIDISYSEVQMLKEAMIETYNFREFTLEENGDKRDALTGELEELGELEVQTIDEFVISSLEQMTSIQNISNEKLIEIYKSLVVE